MTGRPLRVALVIGTLNRGGAEGQLCRLAVELRRSGHDVRVFCLIEGGPLASILDDGGVPWDVMGFQGVAGTLKRLVAREAGPARASLRAVSLLASAMLSFRPDVCHAWLWWSYALTLPVAAFARVPVRIIGLRGLVKCEQSMWRRLVSLPAVVLSSAAIANAEMVMRSHASVDARFVRRRWVVPNGVEIPMLVAHPGEEPPRGVCVSNLIPYKGHQDLVRALSLMAAPPVVRCLGEGPERRSLQREIERLDLDDNVLLEGSHAAPLSVLAASQFFILPSHTEGSPNAVLEAMAAGLPVVATSVGGVPDLVEDGLTGFLVPPHDPAALANAIARLLADPQLREDMGRAARQRAREFSWERCAARHVALYREALGG